MPSVCIGRIQYDGTESLSAGGSDGSLFEYFRTSFPFASRISSVTDDAVQFDKPYQQLREEFLLNR